MAISREVKVGVFVLFGMIAAGAIVFLIGDNRSVFDDKVSFRAHFDDVQGLKTGSTIQMGGVNIGTVGSVEYSDDLGQPRIQVRLFIVEREAQRLRQDSEITIVPKGLLGDKMMAITAGDQSLPVLEPNSVVPSTAPGDMLAMLDGFKSLTSSAERILGNLESTTGVLAEDEFRQDVRAGVAALSHLLQSLDKGEGYVGRLLHDKEEAENVSRLVASLEQTSGRVDSIAAGLDGMVRQINEGPGLTHELLYGEEGARSVAEFSSAAAEIRDSLRALRQGNGLARAVLFGGAGQGEEGTELNELGQTVASDVAGMSSDLAAVVRGLREGKGTLGALLVDPSVYEDVKMLLGNVQRNQALRALVRYSIQSDSEGDSVKVSDPKGVQHAQVATPQ